MSNITYKFERVVKRFSKFNLVFRYELDGNDINLFVLFEFWRIEDWKCGWMIFIHGVTFFYLMDFEPKLNNKMYRLDE